MQQVEQGESLDTQQVRIQQWAALHQLGDIEEFYIEKGVSGSKPLDQREEGGRLLSNVVKGDVIVACRLDRVFRSALNALEMIEQLREKGVHLHLIDLNGDVMGEGLSRLFLTIIAAVAEQERVRIAERITDVKRQQRSLGKFLGGKRRFGYQVDDNGYEVEDVKEQVVIKDIVNMRSQGKTYDAIVSEVADKGFPLSRGGIFKIYNRYKDAMAV